MYFTTRKFWTDLTERTVSTAAQSALGVVAAASFGLLELNSWKAVAAAAGGAGLVAVLKAFGVGRGEVPPIAPPTYFVGERGPEVAVAVTRTHKPFTE